MIIFYIFIFLISCLLLARSGTWIIQALIKIARFLKWKEFMVASLLMAFATSLPELFVGISSALHKKPWLSFGDVIGSNIIVLTLIMGGGTLMAKRIKFEGKTLQKSTIYACLIASLPLFLILDKKISRTEGVILLLTSVLYFYWLLSQKERFAKLLFQKLKNRGVRFRAFLRALSIFMIGVFLLLLSAEGIVWSTSNLAREYHLPLVTVGILLIAIGTSIPEIAFGIKSITTNHEEMILGDAMGSVVVNSSLVLGVTALICPIEISDLSPYFAGIIFTIITCTFFAIFAKTGREITRKEAAVLILIYFLFLTTEFLIK